jgi:hypothetical protein
MARKKKGNREGDSAERTQRERSGKLGPSAAGQDVQGWRDMGGTFAARVVSRSSRLAADLARRTGMVSRIEQPKGLPVWRPEYPGAGRAGWADRLLAPVRNLTGYVHRKFERTSLLARQPVDLLWFNRARRERTRRPEVGSYSDTEGLPLEAEPSGHPPWQAPGEHGFEESGGLPDRDTGPEALPSFTISKQERHLSGEAVSPGVAKTEKMVREVSQRLGVQTQGPSQPGIARSPAVAGSPPPGRESRPEGLRTQFAARREASRAAQATPDVVGPGGDAPAARRPVPGREPRAAAPDVARKPSPSVARAAANEGDIPVARQPEPSAGPDETLSSVVQRPPVQAAPMRVSDVASLSREVASRWQPEPEARPGVAEPYSGPKPVVHAQRTGAPAVSRLAEDVAASSESRVEKRPSVAAPGDPAAVSSRLPLPGEAGRAAVARAPAEAGTQRGVGRPRGDVPHPAGVAKAVSWGPETGTVQRSERETAKPPIAQLVQQKTTGFLKRVSGVPQTAISRWQVGKQEERVATPLERPLAGYAQGEGPSGLAATSEAAGVGVVGRPMHVQRASVAPEVDLAQPEHVGREPVQARSAAAGTGAGSVSKPASKAWPLLIHEPITSQAGSSTVARGAISGQTSGGGPDSFVERVLYRTGASRLEAATPPSGVPGQAPLPTREPDGWASPGISAGLDDVSRFASHERPAAPVAGPGSRAGRQPESGAPPLTHLLPPIAGGRGFGSSGGWDFVQAKRDYSGAPAEARWERGKASPMVAAADFAGQSVVQTAHAEWRASEEHLPLAVVGGGISRNGNGQADISRAPLYRAEAGEVATTESTAGEGTESKPDLDELARKLYPRIKQMLAIERERRGF